MAVLMITLLSSVAYASGGGGEHHTNWTFVGSLIFNFVAFIALLFVLLKKPVGNFFAERSDSIAEQLNRADKAREEAESKIREYGAKIDEIMATRDEVLAKAKKEADYERERILCNAKVAADRIMAEADSSITVEMERARQQLVKEASQQISELAEKLLQEAVNKTDQERLADDYIEMLREVKS